MLSIPETICIKFEYIFANMQWIYVVKQAIRTAWKVETDISPDHDTKINAKAQMTYLMVDIVIRFWPLNDLSIVIFLLFRDYNAEKKTCIKLHENFTFISVHMFI